MEQNKTQQYMIPLSIVVAGLLIAVGIYFGGVHSAPQAQNGQQKDAVKPLPLTTEGDPFIGNPDAKLTIYYWTDFQCPFCKQFEQTSLQNVVKDFISTNKAKLVFKDMQFLGQDSFDSALIARAIWELYPDKYYVWREGYYAKQDDEKDQGFGDAASVLAYTKTVSGIDADKVKAKVDEKAAEYQKLLAADSQQGHTNGIKGTPGVIVKDAIAQNPLDYPALKALIESKL